MAATRPTVHPVVLGLTTPRPLTTTDHLSAAAEAPAWWDHRRVRGEETATTGEMTRWEEGPTEGGTFTEEAVVGEEETQDLEAEGEEVPEEEDTTIWTVPYFKCLYSAKFADCAQVFSMFHSNFFFVSHS